MEPTLRPSFLEVALCLEAILEQQQLTAGHSSPAPQSDGTGSASGSSAAVLNGATPPGSLLGRGRLGTGWVGGVRSLGPCLPLRSAPNSGEGGPLDRQARMNSTPVNMGPNPIQAGLLQTPLNAKNWGGGVSF